MKVGLPLMKNVLTPSANRGSVSDRRSYLKVNLWIGNYNINIFKKKLNDIIKNY